MNRQRLVLAVIVTFGAVLRLASLDAHPAIADDAGMAVTPTVMAESLRDGDGFATPAASGALAVPGQAVVLAATWAIAPGNDDLTAIQYLQVVLLEAVNIVLVFAVGRRLFDARAGLVAALLYAAAPGVIVLSTQLLEAVWVTTAVLTATLLWAQGRHPAWIGLAVGVGAYFRPTTLLVPVALAIGTWALGRRREALRVAALGIGVGYLIFVPWVIRQSATYDAVLPLGRTGTGQTAWEALGRLPNDHGAVLNDEITFLQVHRDRPELVYGSPEYDAYLLDRWKTAAGDDPLHVLDVAQTQARIILLWPSLNYSDVDTSADDQHADIVLVLALAGLALSWRRREWVALAALVLLWAAAHAPFVLATRMVLPAIAPAYVLVAGAGVSELVSRITAPQRATAAIPA